MKPGKRLRKRIDKAVRRDLQRHHDDPDDSVLNAFAFMMEVNEAILQTIAELTAELERMKRRSRR